MRSRSAPVLAWSRTGAAVAVVAALQLRVAAGLGSVVGVVLGLGCVAAGLGVHVVGRGRYRPGSSAGAGLSSPTALRVATAVALLVCAAGVWSVLLGLE